MGEVIAAIGATFDLFFMSLLEGNAIILRGKELFMSFVVLC